MNHYDLPFFHTSADLSRRMCGICLARGCTWSPIGQGIVSILLADARNMKNVLDLSDGFGAEEKHIV